MIQPNLNLKSGRNICCLPLECWMTYYIDDEDGREENRYSSMPPILHRDGWFWDRLAKREWWEHRGQAFLISTEGKDFLYNLRLANARALSAREVAAYREILRLRPPLDIARRVDSALRLDQEIKYLRSIRRNGLKRRLRFMRLRGAGAQKQPADHNSAG